MPGTRAILATAAALLLLAAASACAPAPREVFLADSPGAAPSPAGTNLRGEACFARPAAAPPALAGLAAAGATEILCEGWTSPSATILRLAGPADAGRLAALAAPGSAWRAALDPRLDCRGAETPSRISGGAAALILSCTRRAGGWPVLAMAAATPEGPVLVEGLPAALPVVERVITGAVPGPAPAGAARSAALQLAVARLSAQAFGAGDISRYDSLMALGRELNQLEDFAGAAEAYRAALAVQDRVLGAGAPDSVAPVLGLALNLANLGRRAEAEALFARAASLAPRAADVLAPTRVLHYRGLAALSREAPAEAERLLAEAERGYGRFVPGWLAERGEFDPLAPDPLAESALLGLVEARRNRAVAIGRQGRTEDATRLAGEARATLTRARLDPDMLGGRMLRTQGAATPAAGEAARLLSTSARRFGAVAGGERPEATAQFLAGARLLETGRRAEALERFRAGAATLRARRAGLPPALVVPYLDALDAAAAARDDAARPALLAEAFLAAQLARREGTERLVAQASARLALGGESSPVAGAVRRLQDSERALRGLLAERDRAAAEGAEAARALDERIAAAEQARGEAEMAAAAAAPGYRQLLVTPATAEEAARALQPGEALVVTLMGPRHGWALALRPAAEGGGIALRRIALSEAEAGALTARLRRSIELTEAGEPPPFDIAAARALHDAVLGPLAAETAGARRLLVAADGPLLSMPFALFLTGPAEQERLAEAPWLIRRHAVAHIPGPQTLVQLRAPAAAAGSAAPLPYAGFGDPVIAAPAALRVAFPPDRCGDDAEAIGGLGALPGTRAEVSVARRLMGAAPEAVKLGPAFTAAALQGSALSRYRVIHLATHALLPAPGSCLGEPALLVSPPGGGRDAGAALLPASRVLEMRLDADLVLLSACNTGTTLGGGGSETGEGGEGLSGLARAFFFAGARGILATHWEVDDLATAVLIAGTLERQAQSGGMPAAEALREAQLAMLRDAGGRLPAAFAHPFHWAPFTLIGDGRRAPPPPAPPPRAGT